MSSNLKVFRDIIFQNSALLKYLTNNSKFEFKFKKFKKFKTIVIIGMGGSILGAKAIYYFMKNKTKKKFIFIDNLNINYLKKIKKENKLNKTLFIIISKSGNTTETIVNLNFFNEFIKEKNTIIISERKNNILYKFAKKRKILFVNHNKNIGGRYSVFSDVSMLPVTLMGFKPEKFKKDIPRFISNNNFTKELIKDINQMNFKKNKVLILFNYIPELNNFMYWIQQIFAESLGKKGKGFTPVISNAPKDHHSLLQLYLDGPRDKLFYVFSDNEKDKKKINTKKFTKEIHFLENKTLNSIKSFQKNAFIKTISKKNIPFREFVFEKFDEETIGELFVYFILETIIIGKLTGVNPFDQPAVEQVKVLTNYYLKKFSK